MQKSLSSIAIEQYKSGGFGDSFQLLFSTDPALYLSSAGALDAITRGKSTKIKKFAAAQQRLNATTLTVNDKVALVIDDLASVQPWAPRYLRVYGTAELVHRGGQNDRIMKITPIESWSMNLSGRWHPGSGEEVSPRKALHTAS